MLVTLRLARSARISIWGIVLDPVNSFRDFPLSSVSGSDGAGALVRSTNDWTELGRAIAAGHVSAAISGGALPGPVNISVDDANAAISNGGTLIVGIVTGGGGGGSTDVVEDPVVYSCPAGLAIRDLVYLTGANSVDKADADNPGTFPAVGFVSAKPSPLTCRVQYGGKIGGFVGLLPNATYHASIVPGEITATPSLAPGDVIQRIGWARDPNNLIITIDRDFVIN